MQAFHKALALDPGYRAGNTCIRMTADTVSVSVAGVCGLNQAAVASLVQFLPPALAAYNIRSAPSSHVVTELVGGNNGMMPKLALICSAIPLGKTIG